MQNLITTNAPAEHAAITWANKAGKTLIAHSHTAQAFAPKAARMAGAMSADLRALTNGQFRPFLADVRASLTKGDIKALTAFGYFIPDNQSPDKATTMAMLQHVGQLWTTAKGKRLALGRTIAQWLAYESARAERKSTSTELESTSTELESAHAELESTSAERKSTSTELESAHAELESAHAELESTSAERKSTSTELTLETV